MLNDALRAETNHIQSIQLWRSIAIDFSYKKNKKKCYIIGLKLRRALLLKKPSIKTVYLYHNKATFALKFEPWILDTANSLSQVHGYQKTTFGDGATLKTESTVQCNKHGIQVPMSTKPPGGNFWFDSD